MPNTVDWSLHVFDASTGADSPVGPSGDASTGGVPVFSPDGQQLVYYGKCATATTTNVCLASRATGAVGVLDDYASGGQPVFDPR